MTTTVGVAGQRWRAEVTTWGAVVPSDGSPALDWYVAADDRWHVPSREPAVRQARAGGTPVTETRVRIPGGDAVHRTWTVADAGGHTVVEVGNESPLPIAVAFTRADLRTSRPPTDVPIHGIDLPTTSTIVLPVAHRASVTVALSHAHDASPGPLPAPLSSAQAVVNGWRATSDRASRLDLPDETQVDAVVSARCDLVLGGLSDPAVDPIGFVLGVAELVRMGDRPDEWIDYIAIAAADAARRGGGDADAALAAAAVVFHRAGERRARDDVIAIAAERDAIVEVVVPPGDVRIIAAVERRLACDGRLLPAGIPVGWRGVGFECRGVPVGPASTLSYAVRWHGDHPAVLWEVTGEPITLTAPAVDPSWRTIERTGETLWPSPHAVT